MNRNQVDGPSFINNPQKNFFLLIILFILIAPLLSAQANEDCLVCHSDDSMEMERNGKTVSLYVDENILMESPHKKLQCVSCHIGFNPDDMPHKEDIKPIDCTTCHKDARVKHPFHVQMMRSGPNDPGADVNCKGCHGTHNVKSFITKTKKEVNLLCTNCHSGQHQEFLGSVHNTNTSLGGKEMPGCLSCHEKQITRTSFGGDLSKTKLAQEQLCQDCHYQGNNPGADKNKTNALIPDHAYSLHNKVLKAGNGEAASCINCHEKHLILPASNPASKVSDKNITATCGSCHNGIMDLYKLSIHSKKASEGNKEAPLCYDCHNEHPDKDLKNLSAIADVCADCHKPVKLNDKFAGAVNILTVFSASYHGLAEAGGGATLSKCGTCHGVHDVVPSEDPASPVNKNNLIKTCGKCHPSADTDFASAEIHTVPAKADIKKEIKQTTGEGSSGFSLFIYIFGGGLLVIGVIYAVIRFTRKKKSD